MVGVSLGSLQNPEGFILRGQGLGFYKTHWGFHFGRICFGSFKIPHCGSFEGFIFMQGFVKPTGVSCAGGFMLEGFI